MSFFDGAYNFSFVIVLKKPVEMFFDITS